MTLTWPVTSGSSLAGDADMESQGDRPHSYPLGESTAQGETQTKLPTVASFSISADALDSCYLRVF